MKYKLIPVLRAYLSAEAIQVTPLMRRDSPELDIAEIRFCVFLTGNGEHFINQIDADDLAGFPNNLCRRYRRFSRARGNIKQPGSGGYPGQFKHAFGDRCRALSQQRITPTPAFGSRCPVIPFAFF